MKKIFIFLLISVVLGGFSSQINAQKLNQSISFNEVKFALDEGWSVEKKDLKKGNYSVVCSRGKDRFDVLCFDRVINLQTAIYEQAGKLKKAPQSEYLSLDDYEPIVFLNKEAVQLRVHNQVVMDFYQGLFIAFEDKGRTFIIFWYTDDKPAKIETFAKILKTVKIK